MGDAVISIIIPITGKSRLRHIHTCLKFLELQAYKDFEIILVEQINCNIGGQKSSTVHYGSVGVNKHIVVSNDLNCMFNQPWMSNVGARVASGNKLLFFDVDMITRANYLDAVAQCDDPFFFAWERCYHYTKKASEKIHKKKRFVLDNQKVEQRAGKLGHAGYAVCADKEFFFNILGGYSENLFGWGGNDQEILARANHFMGYHARALPVPIFHLWHPRGYAKPSGANRTLVKLSRRYPKLISKRIKKAQVGKKSNPTLIQVNDLMKRE